MDLIVDLAYFVASPVLFSILDPWKNVHETVSQVVERQSHGDNLQPLS